ncbi:MAG: GntR family transcriptional regulator [Alphaproteobacteria bacterium]|nr:MAG: GntR family transcriptional regulator [Alphaproteobacteria bacterium]
MHTLAQNARAAGSRFLGVRKGNVVYHAIKRSILLREARPGTLLLEQHIATEYGCSQGTVREALLRLEQDGLVTRRGYRGTVVSDTTLEEAARMAIIRIELEMAGARRAALGLPDEDIAELTEAIEQMEEASRAGDPYLCSELDRAFHLRIFQAAGMPALEPILMRCALHMHRYTFGNADKCSQHETPVAAQHAAILRALQAGDAEAAAAAVRDHIEAVIDLWAPTLRRAIEASATGRHDGAEPSPDPAAQMPGRL